MKPLATALLLTLLALPATADVCDHIDDLAFDWADIADTLELDAGEEIADLDVRRLTREVGILCQPTEDLAYDLIDLGNRREEKLGNVLLDLVENLDDVEEGDLAAYLVDRIDDIVLQIDEIVEYCDAVVE